MPRSFAQSGQAPCPECGQPVPFKVWLIVDIAERPELAEQVRDNSLHTVTCPHCAHVGQIDAPLLVHDPARERVLFAPAQGSTSDQDQQILKGLLGQLATTFPAPQPGYLGRVMPVPRPALPALLDADDLAAALEQVAAQASEALTQLKREDPETFRQIEAQARLALDGTPPLLQTLQTFIFAETWADSRRVLEAHLELLEQETDDILGQLVKNARAGKDEETARHIQEHRELLRRCREQGLEAAFATKKQPKDSLD